MARAFMAPDSDVGSGGTNIERNELICRRQIVMPLRPRAWPVRPCDMDRGTTSGASGKRVLGAAGSRARRATRNGDPAVVGR